ncbi:regulatory protein RecX [Neotamlana laminarinivorans]|uniref:Regulatory protein RecX n=1 Tax=Neotamlana laminarinivorans TaxID=2883124 RepID=A0A9X1I119_9FLAO|nr:regulatory protein RecX [Tamlana laminarinivorans]MCB4798024.1 recombination regulator RecX [Tamlana laminarinivorans]
MVSMFIFGHMLQPKKTYTLQEAIKKLEHYCAYQERCHKEVRQKLITMHMIPEAIDTVIVHLLQHNFLNEERFAKTFVRGKFRIKKWGRRRLSLELKKKDISKVNINEAFKEISETEYIEVFNDLAEKKASTLNGNTHKNKKKLIDYLLYRGWESHLVYDKANELFS